MPETGRSDSGLESVAGARWRPSCAGRREVRHVRVLGSAVARQVQQAGTVVEAESASNKRVHAVRGDTAISIDLFVEQPGVAEVRREQRQFVGAFASGLH